MREDMAKVIVTRPRLGGTPVRKSGKRAQCAMRCPEEATRFEPMSRGRGTKVLNEHLSPLERFLERRRGQHWDSVFSEICRNLRPSNTVQQHVRDHLWDFVLLNVRVECGVLVAYPKYGDPEPLKEMRYGPRFYVCPRSGQLRERRRRRRRVFARDAREVQSSRYPGLQPEEIRWDGRMRLICQIDDVWYALALANLPADREDRRGLVDRLVNRDLSESTEGSRILRDQLGVAGVYVEQKRQLGKRELKRMFELPKTRKEKLR